MSSAIASPAPLMFCMQRSRFRRTSSGLLIPAPAQQMDDPLTLRRRTLVHPRPAPEGWFWIRIVGAPRDGDPRDGGTAPVDSRRCHIRGHSVQTELVALDVLHHDARLVVA